ncbi:MAG: peptidyl-prolyl cis-trans isomerase, partial [Bacteroidota bacterium]
SDKYSALIKGGLYTTTFETEMNHQAQNTNFDARIILKKYSDVADKDIQYNDQDLQNYYNAHLYEFQNETPSRSIDYVVWDVAASRSDVDSLTAELNRLKSEFSTTELSEDSAYTQAQNPNGVADVSSSTRDKLSPEIDSSFFVSPVKTVFGPFKEGNNFKLIKLRGTDVVSDSGRVRHILIAKANPRSQDIKRTPEQAKKTADSLKDLLTKDRKRWDEFCEKYSDDPGKKRPDIKGNPELIKNKQAFPTGDTNIWTGKGGDYGWVNENSGYVPEFKSFALTGKTGQIGVVATDFGYHIMEVLEVSKTQKNKFKLATITRDIKPGDATRQDFLTQASDFAGQNNTAEKFQKAVDAKKLNKRVNDDLKENDMYLPGFQSQSENPKQLIREIYKASSGQVLSPIIIGDKIVVALVKKIKEKGTLPFEVVKEEVTNKVKEEKKAEKILAEFNSRLKSVKSIDELAGKSGLTVEKAEKIQFNAYSVPKFGKEDELIATLSCMKKGEIKVGKGSGGVWAVQVDNIIDAEKIKDIKALQKNFMMGNATRAQYEPIEALKKLANIEDHKARFDY